MSLIERGALEVSKPAAGLISAALKPYIKKVEAWAEDKSLNSQLSEEHLNNIFSQYITDLAHRVSEITSIAFPQHQLSIFSTYEPLKLYWNPAVGERRLLETDDILKLDSGSFIIKDGAGVGKSTFSKHLVSSILHKHAKIPILLELRNIPPESSLMDALSSELDTICTKFPNDLFLKLVQRGDFVMILDGFDEVQLERQEDLAKQINSLSSRARKNTLFVTTRPQDIIPSISQSVLLEFSEFNEVQCKSLLRRYDTYCGLDIGEKLIKQLEFVPDKFIKTPLLVSLLYRTFGVNNSIANSISTFYEEVYSALYKGHDLLNKNGYSRQKKSGLDYEKFRTLLRSLCYYMLVNRTTSFKSWSEAIDFIDNAIKLKKVDVTSSASFLDDLLTSVPLMIREGNEYKFLHKTIIEYFAAEYIIYSKNSTTTMDKIFNGKLSSGFEKVFDFIKDIDLSLFHSIVTVKYAKEIISLKDEFDYHPALQSSFYLHDLHLGFWDVERHCDELEFDEGPENLNVKSAQIRHDIQMQLFEKRLASRISWSTYELDEREYAISVARADKALTYKSLCLEYLCDIDVDNDIDIDIETLMDFDDIESVDLSASDFDWIEKNKWVRVDQAICQQIVDSTFLTRRVLEHEIHPVISYEKCRDIISLIEQEEEMESSVDSLL
ncbi:NACHT domain-containing NTPase [Vibrio splendidus]